MWRGRVKHKRMIEEPQPTGPPVDTSERVEILHVWLGLN